MYKFIKKQEEIIKKVINECGYNIQDVSLVVSNRPDLGQYQFNGIMSLAKEYKMNPRVIADSVVEKLKELDIYKDINVAGPGFINLTFKDELLIDFINNINSEEEIKKDKRIFLDYGGPNVAKTLHVGHLRSANIGESLKQLLKELNYDVISDIHLGDWGRQMGLIILELKTRYPNWVYFDESYEGEYPDTCPITNSDLESLYPIASSKAKEDEDYLNEAREITTKLQNKSRGYYALWKQIVKISTSEIKETYDKLNVSFDLWNGESDAEEYIDEVINYLKEKNLVYLDQGSLIMDVSSPDDTYEVPPVLLIKSNGSVSYEMTDLATIWERVKKYNPDEIWYVVDKRQELHFKQVFRAAYKSGIASENLKLEFLGFGTMNGTDGKPFKTRDGGVMSLKELISLVKNETMKKLGDNINDTEKDEISDIIATASLKYADLLSTRTTDYIFDPVKFSDMNGKTGVYLLYSTIRMKALLQKAKDNNIEINSYKMLKDDTDRNIVLTLLEYPSVLQKARISKSLNEISDYIYRLTNIYNNFYSSNKVLIEEDKNIRESWLYLSKIVMDTNLELLKIMGIKVPSKI